MTTAAPRAFAVLSSRGFRAHLSTSVLAMMADNIEHVISYWMMYQKFHSPALAGFAVVAHWVPHLLFSVPAGALVDRSDPRRVIQVGLVLFIVASVGWGFFFLTDTLQPWHAMLLLTIHGFASLLWNNAAQVLVHDIVPREELAGAVRLNATGRYVGILVGPGVGGLLLVAAGPIWGIFANALFYVPALLWLWKAPYGPKFRREAPSPQRAVRGFADITQTLRDIGGQPVIVSMVALAGAASFFVGNSYHAQMPSFATDLGHGDPGVTYSALLAADACGALIGGLLLEKVTLFKLHPRSALVLAILWALTLAVFAMSSSYTAAIVLLLVAGFFEIAFSSIAQALVQLHAPAEIRGRVIGLYNMAALGMRAFAGVTVGLAGSVLGVHVSLLLSALMLLAVVVGLLVRYRRSTGAME